MLQNDTFLSNILKNSKLPLFIKNFKCTSIVRNNKCKYIYFNHFKIESEICLYIVHCNRGEICLVSTQKKIK